jgi:hypothetical protein
MRAAVLALCLVAAPAVAEDILLPGGQTVTLAETSRDAAGPAGLTERFRFTAPWITQAAYEDLVAAMAWLCTTIALPRVATAVPPPAQIVISLADRDVPFGATDPAATQVFEGYAIAGDTCEAEFF